ncbi:MAG: pseudouridine synthase [Ignavibacteria bacterium]|nr:pseudouridine synthase [Ignavibacteria bacterium]
MKPPRPRYILFNKPYGVLSQFTDPWGRQTLADFGPFPKDVYPVGRLDADTEGLLLLTNDNEMKHRLLDPRFEHPRTYLALVERMPSGEALEKLRRGVTIERRKTKPAAVMLCREEPALWDRPVPIRFRKSVPTAWLEITLMEGRNRQVRKMTASIGHPTLRLVRIAFGPLTIQGIRPGEFRDLRSGEVRDLLRSVNRSA